MSSAMPFPGSVLHVHVVGQRKPAQKCYAIRSSNDCNSCVHEVELFNEEPVCVP